MRRKTELTEIMDDPAVSPDTLAGSLRFIRRVNRYLGGTRAVLGPFQHWARQGNWYQQHETITLLDVATGSADIPLAILHWAHRAGIRMHATALDCSPIMLNLAREHITSNWRGQCAPPIHFVQGDALSLPFADQAFDYATCSMFMHHLSEKHALAALHEMLRVSRRGIVVNDLLRSTFAKAGIRLLTVFSSPTDKNDARVSVAKAWTRREIERWPKQASAPWLRYHYHLPARFTLAGER